MRRKTSPGLSASWFRLDLSSIRTLGSGANPTRLSSSALARPSAAGARRPPKSGRGETLVSNSAAGESSVAGRRQTMFSGSPPELRAARSRSAKLSAATPSTRSAIDPGRTPASNRVASLSLIAPATTSREARTSVIVALRAVSTPIERSPTFGSRSGNTLKRCLASPRATVISRAVSGFAIAAARRRSRKVCAGSPSIETTRSPGRRPFGTPSSSEVARIAGELGMIAPIVGAGNRTPARKATRNSTIASMRFAAMPARITTPRRKTLALVKLCASSLTAAGLPSSCPSMRT